MITLDLALLLCLPGILVLCMAWAAVEWVMGRLRRRSLMQ